MSFALILVRGIEKDCANAPRMSSILKRITSTVGTLAAVSLVVFLLLRLAPGDAAALIAGDHANTDDIDRLRERLGLSEPVWIQFGLWLSQLVQGDLGHSYYLDRPVASLIVERLEPTLSLAIGTVVLAILIGVPLGTLAASRTGSWLDRLVSAGATLGFSVPAFVVAYGLIHAFAVELHWLPAHGYHHLAQAGDGDLVRWAQHLLMPWLTLAVPFSALMMRVTRGCVAEALAEDFVHTARAKGLREGAVLVRHALASVAVPITAVVGIGFVLLVGGVVVTETVYAIPGLGSLTVDAVLNRDFPVVQGIVLVFSVANVLIHMLIDMSYPVLDPRIRF